jgi:hypothetical protein
MVRAFLVKSLDLFVKYCVAACDGAVLIIREQAKSSGWAAVLGRSHSPAGRLTF